MGNKKKFDLKRKDPRFKKIQLTVDTYQQWVKDEDGLKQGLTRFRTFTTDVLDEETGEIIGAISGGTGAVTLTRKDGDEWTIHHDDLWYAFVEVLEKENVD